MLVSSYSVPALIIASWPQAGRMNHPHARFQCRFMLVSISCYISSHLSTKFFLEILTIPDALFMYCVNSLFQCYLYSYSCKTIVVFFGFELDDDLLAPSRESNFIPESLAVHCTCLKGRTWRCPCWFRNTVLCILHLLKKYGSEEFKFRLS